MDRSAQHLLLLQFSSKLISFIAISFSPKCYYKLSCCLPSLFGCRHRLTARHTTTHRMTVFCGKVCVPTFKVPLPKGGTMAWVIAVCGHPGVGTYCWFSLVFCSEISKESLGNGRVTTFVQYLTPRAILFVGTTPRGRLLPRPLHDRAFSTTNQLDKCWGGNDLDRQFSMK